MLEYYNIGKLKLAIVLMKYHIIKSFVYGGGQVRFVWPWMFP